VQKDEEGAGGADEEEEAGRFRKKLREKA